MCEFISAIIMKNGDMICRPDLTDSHEDLVHLANIHDGLAQQGQFVRVEFTPGEDIFDLDSWKFNLDEDSKPDWFDEDKAISGLRAKVRKMFVTDERDFLLGGCWILGKEVKVERVKNARIYSMLGSSQVRVMLGSSQVREMYDSSQVRVMYGSSQVGEMYDSSQVRVMLGSSQVRVMHGSSQVGEMYDSSQVGWMHGNSLIKEINDKARVIEKYDESKILKDNRRDKS